MVRLFLVTANVGSVFDNLELGLPVWLYEFSSAVRSRDPEFLAIHFQETGGKSYDNASDTIKEFFRQLVDRMELLNFRVAEAFVDSTSDLEDQFTALSSIYFVHESLRLPVHIWDFQDVRFHEVSRILTPSSQSLHPNIHMGPSLSQINLKQKEKFPQDFYPNFKWSRKGFLRTRWRFGSITVDLVNIHLFHDSCNLMAASTYPSPFAQHREKTLKYTLERIQSDGLEKAPLFIFGDFNFRLDTHGVMDVLKKDFGDPVSKLCETNSLVLATKKFQCPDQELRFKLSYDWLKQYDFESKQFPDLVQECDLNFHPTYPFSEEINEPERYMRTRVPAWCDRVLFTPSTRDHFSKDFSIEYNLIGSKVCMGDHKPVGLSVKMQTNRSENLRGDSGTNSTCDPCNNIKGNSVTVMLISKFSKSSTSLSISPTPMLVAGTSKGSTMAVACSTDAIETQSYDENISDAASFVSYRSVQNGSVSLGNDGVGAEMGFGDGDTGLKNSAALTASSSDLSNTPMPLSPVEDVVGGAKSSCFLFHALLRCRGKMRFSQGNLNGDGGGNNNTGHINCNKALSSLKALSKYKRGGSGATGRRSGSLLEPIANAGCDFACSSLSSSQASSQRPSVTADTDHIDPTGDKLNRNVKQANFFGNFFVASSQSTLSSTKLKRCKDCCQSTSGRCCCRHSGISVEEASVIPKDCQNRLMHNLTTMISNNCSTTSAANINSSRNNMSNGNTLPLGSSNLSLIAINSNTDLDKSLPFVDSSGKIINDCSNENNGRIPVCWATTTYHCNSTQLPCSNCINKNVSVSNRNLHNLSCSSCSQHHYYSTVEKNSKPGKCQSSGLPFNFKTSSKSQVPVQCKCHLTSNASTDGCMTCSKCVIL